MSDETALARFTEWFARNYPGPDTVIYNPHWHAPKIFRAALEAACAAVNGDGWRTIDKHDGSEKPFEVYRDGDHFFAWLNSEGEAPYWDADLEYGGKPIEPPPTHFREIVGPHLPAQEGVGNLCPLPFAGPPIPDAGQKETGGG